MESHQVYLIGRHNKSALGMLSLSGQFRWTWCRVYNYVLYTEQRHLQSTPYSKAEIDTGRPQTWWKGNSTGTNKWEPHPHASGYFFRKREIFSFVLAFRPHVNGVFARQKSRFPKASPEWSFWRRWLIVFVWAKENRLFSTICYHISIVLAFSCGRAKTIWIRYVWTRIFTKTEEKISVVKNIRICLDRALFRPTCSTVFEALQVEATIKSKLTRWKVKTDKIFIFFFQGRDWCRLIS